MASIVKRKKKYSVVYYNNSDYLKKAQKYGQITG